MRLPSIALSLVALLLVAIVSEAAGAQVPTASGKCIQYFFIQFY